MIWAPFTTTTSQTVHVGQKLHCLLTLSPTRFTVAEVSPEAYSVYTSTTTELLYLDKLGVAVSAPTLGGNHALRKWGKNTQACIVMAVR